MSKDTNELLGHADEADGIEEYDNPLPDWWVGLFWITIIWAIGYTAHYHFIGNRSFENALAAEMAAAEERWPAEAAAAAAAASAETFAITPELVSAGEALYATQCIACHGPTGRGNPASVVPSVRGQYAVYNAVQLRAYASGERATDGPTRVMRDIASRLSEEEILAVASYMQGLQ